jgi:thioesterase domain-containing protein
MSASVETVERYLHSRIPVTVAMGIRVRSIDEVGVRLWAPLQANINHRDTVFGGSASALAILSAWTLLFVRLHETPLRSRLVIQRNTVEYLKPLEGDFEALCLAPAAPEWERFLRSLERRGRARISLHAELRCQGELGGTFHGTYVADLLSGEGH